jgi:hypothetical protein
LLGQHIQQNSASVTVVTLLGTGGLRTSLCSGTCSGFDEMLADTSVTLVKFVPLSFHLSLCHLWFNRSSGLNRECLFKLHGNIY